MSQHDMNVANDTFPNFHADMNAAFAALVSNNSGGSAPGTPFAYMWWADTTTGLLKIRNAANSAWITIGALAAAGLGISPVGATQSEQEAASSTTVMVTPQNQKFNPSSLKGHAAVQPDGTVVIGYNVASTTDSGAGDMTVNWTVPFSTTIYPATACARSDANLIAVITQTNTNAGSTRILVRDPAGTPTDPSYFMVTVAGDQ